MGERQISDWNEIKSGITERFLFLHLSIYFLPIGSLAKYPVTVGTGPG